MEYVENHQELKPGDVVRISDMIDHDFGYKGQVGIVEKVTIDYVVDNGDPFAYVLAWDARAERFWCCGFNAKLLTPLGYQFDELIEGYAHWMVQMQDQDSVHSFLKKLKKIRKEYKEKNKTKLKQ